MGKITIDKGWRILFLIATLSLTIIPIVIAPPFPHNVDGQVFFNLSQGIGAPAGLTVRINDTVTNYIVIVYTENPAPELSGIYSATINGNDDDLIMVTSWNGTHYGAGNATLNAGTTTINIEFNYTRQSEANVTILEPLNNSVKNNTAVFNVTANITIIGNNGIDCNASINFSNGNAKVINGDSTTKILGSLNIYEHTNVTWGVLGANAGEVNITIKAYCSSDGIIVEKLNSYTISTSIIIFGIQGPQWQSPSINDTSVEQFDFVRFNASWSDDQNLSSYIFSTNSTGMWMNVSNQSFSSISNESNFTMQINASVNAVVGWTFYANDTSNNFNVTDVQTFVVVSPHHVFYGNIYSDVVLGDSTNLSITAWFNSSDVKGNIYVADTDTKNGIQWASLQAIGKDSLLNDVQDDWENIDGILGMTSSNESINRTFTLDYKPKNKTDFTVIGFSIANVSTINSTNSSNFLTGILWDTSDSLDSQYDATDKEDIIFITKVNNRNIGLYGNYHYEIKVPAKLKQYRSPNIEDSISFYVELT